VIFYLLINLYAFEVKEIKIKNISLKVEVADEDHERAKGMMFRKSFGEIDGMLFIFPTLKEQSFWMKNTLIPLSIGFFDAQKILIDIQQMAVPKSQKELKNYKSIKPAKYALEVPKGWFQKNKVGLGSRLDIK